MGRESLGLSPRPGVGLERGRGGQREVRDDVVRELATGGERRRRRVWEAEISEMQRDAARCSEMAKLRMGSEH